MAAVRPGLVELCTAKPSVETLGYYHASLRDENEILVTLDEAVPAPFMNRPLPFVFLAMGY